MSVAFVSQHVLEYLQLRHICSGLFEVFFWFYIFRVRMGN